MPQWADEHQRGEASRRSGCEADPISALGPRDEEAGDRPDYHQEVSDRTHENQQESGM